MAARKPKPVVVEPVAIMEWNEPKDTITVTRDDLEKALLANMKHKLGAGPVEGQFDDLWRRLTES